MKQWSHYPDTTVMGCMVKIVGLLVEELRPMANANAQVKDLQNDILNMLSTKVNG